ncbi:MAG: cation diffusion facilitator family transporter [Desulfobulbaceae bacterium]|jgi:cobalt-zinc-cadmium efflux system protein|nr:cation diffusion facilitator family transporter [Desulfobulbaceae bacterium]
MAHNHSHAPRDFNRPFAIAIILNLAFVVIEVAYGIVGNSLALVADAGHNFSDVMTLLLAWGAMAFATRGATARHTFGFKKGTIVASLFSAMLLYAAMGIIIWEAIGRFRMPALTSGMTIIVVAAIGVVINTATALLFISGRKHDLNIKGAFLHMAADAVVSAGVVAAGFAIAATGWQWLDPLVSIAIAIIVLIAGWGLLRESFHLTMAGVPAHIDAEEVLAFLNSLPGVSSVHDLHIWAGSTTENMLIAHLVMPEGSNDDFLHETTKRLHHDFKIHHATLQIEQNGSCGISTYQTSKCWPE